MPLTQTSRRPFTNCNCSSSDYTYTKDEAKFWLREKIEVLGVVPRANIHPTASATNINQTISRQGFKTRFFRVLMQ